MGLFKKKEKKEEVPKLPELPTLPELPRLPEFEKFEEKLPQLPSFPNGDLGNKFSQNTIKEAITGKKEEEVQAEEMEEEIPMMRQPRVKEESETYFEKSMPSASEPIFIRMDKFEDGSKSFEEVKKKVAEIEKMLAGVKQIKEDEEKELQSWTNEIMQIKEKLEKVDDDIFSKVR
jgi:DNA repair exonuclease SbcCD ATPase subunit